MADKLFLAINADSQLAKLVKRLAENPVISTSKVCESWLQSARGGGKTNLSPTRGSFILDALAEAVEGKDGAESVRKGVYAIRGVREALTSEKPGHKLDVIEEKKVEIISADSVKVSAPEAKAPAKNGTGGQVDASVQGQEGRPVQVEITAMPTPGGKVKAGDVEIVFPNVPGVIEVRKNWVKPEWYDDMEAALDNGLHVSIEGPPGTGKSTAAEQYFATRKRPFVTINSDAGLRRRDLVGSIELADGTTRFVTAEYAAAAIFGWGVIINEVNAADADALLFLNGQLEVPFTVNIHGRSFPVHKDFRAVVTYNHGLHGTKPLPPAFKDRFFPIKLDFPGEKVLTQILRANGLPSDAIYAPLLTRFAAAAWDLHVKGNMRYQITPRRLFQAIFLIENRNLSVKEAITRAVIKGVDTRTDQAALESVLAKLEADVTGRRI